MSTDAVENLPRVFPTVVHMLADAAARFPEATALICGRADAELRAVPALRRRFGRRVGRLRRARQRALL